MPHRFKTASATVFAALFAFVSLSFSQPTLSTPTNGAINQPLSVNIGWNAFTGASGYMLQVDIVSNFSSPLIDQSGLVVTSELINGLLQNTTYFWRVNASVGTGTSGWSAVWSFATIPNPPAMPVLSSPSSGTIGQPVPTNLAWNADAGAASYALQVSNTSSFTTFAFNQAGLTSTSQPVGGLAATATYYWRVNATNAGGTSAWSGAWSFTTPLFPSAAPSLSTPSNGAANEPIMLTLAWNSVANATGYAVMVATTSDFSVSFAEGSVSSTQFVVSGLANAATYYWEVNAFSANGTSPWSGAWHFSTVITTPAAPVLAGPASGTGDQGTSITLSWNTATNAASYGIQVSSTSNFTTFTFNKTGVTTLSEAVTGLALNTTYYWQVNATNAGGTSAWSGAWSFSTVGSVPVVPTLVSPSNSALTGLSPTLSWSLVIGATTYGLQVSTSAAFGSTVFSQTALTSNSQPITLTAGIYYWRARATNAGGSSTWSASWLFAAEPASVIAAGEKIPASFARLDNEILTYAIQQPGTVSIALFAVNGRQVMALTREQAAGSYRLSLRDRAISDGRYILQFRSGSLNRQMEVFLSNR